MPALAVAAGRREARVLKHSLNHLVGDGIVCELAGGECGANDFGDVHDRSYNELIPYSEMTLEPMLREHP